ncbi:hypothetical protein Mapa_011982 [Marchantia paleacea]|nr:hypothetical protein Mapa_011982 [Marchantia paleacea]
MCTKITNPPSARQPVGRLGSWFLLLYNLTMICIMVSQHLFHCYSRSFFVCTPLSSWSRNSKSPTLYGRGDAKMETQGEREINMGRPDYSTRRGEGRLPTTITYNKDNSRQESKSATRAFLCLKISLASEKFEGIRGAWRWKGMDIAQIRTFARNHLILHFHYHHSLYPFLHRL